jgi:hypothetical protein
MLGFLRRRPAGGRHTLGAAVTGIPTAPRRPAVPQPLVSQPSHPGRVELGFRDGSSAVLEPTSAQARELLALAGLLRGPR